jgi:hypothetical protein
VERLFFATTDDWIVFPHATCFPNLQNSSYHLVGGESHMTLCESLSPYILSYIQGVRMKHLPKMEHHLHIGGAWPLPFLEKIASPADFAALLCAMIEKIDRKVNYHDVFQAFILIGKIVKTEQHIGERHPVSIGTDDPLIFRTTLTKEYELAARLLGMPPQEIEASQHALAPYNFKY